MSATKQLKAYRVDEGYEGHGVIVFATNSAAARREGANELGIEWESVESCRREHWADEYAPGPVSPLAMVDHGWWMTCHNCERRISIDMGDELRDEGLDPDDYTPVEDGHRVYCCQYCAASDYRRRTMRTHAKADLIELVLTKWPGVQITWVHVYDDSLERFDSKYASTVSFFFPGGDFAAHWAFGAKHVSLQPQDVDAWMAFTESREAAK